MSLSIRLLILGVLFLVINCKYSEQASHFFMAYNFQREKNFVRIVLSDDEDKIAIISYHNIQGTATFKLRQDIFNFNGKKICQVNMLPNQDFIGWPSKTGGLYIDYENNSLMKANSSCSPQYYLGNYLESRSESTASTNKGSFIAFAFINNSIVEYNLGSDQVTRQFKLNNDDRNSIIDYSHDHEYLYAGIFTQSGYKVTVFEVKSGERKHQMNTDLRLLKGLNNGDSFIAVGKDFTPDSKILFNVNKNGTKKQIWAPSISKDYYQYNHNPYLFCTKNNLLLTIRRSGTSKDLNYEFVFYDTHDGSVYQTIPLNFEPLIWKSIVCNDKYLVLMDMYGNVYIHEYSHIGPQPHREIIFIVAGLLIIIAGIFRFIIPK